MENLIELKKIAKEMYQLYILLINFIEKNDKKNIFELSKKINEYKSKEEEILATLDEKTIENLYNYALDNIEENTLKTLKRKYLFEYLVNNLDYEDFLDIKDYLYSLKKVNFTISEFKKVINERGISYGR